MNEEVVRVLTSLGMEPYEARRILNALKAEGYRVVRRTSRDLAPVAQIDWTLRHD